MEEVADYCERLRSKIRGKIAAGDDGPFHLEVPSADFAAQCVSYIHRVGLDAKYGSGADGRIRLTVSIL